MIKSVWVRNQGAACTSASLLIALGLLGVPHLPTLGEASRRLGAGFEFGAPALFDYVTLPGRRAPLDVRVERMAAERGRPVTSRTGLVFPGAPLRPRPGEVLVAHLAYGQEAPGRYGAWGFRPLRLATWSTGGHSVVLLSVHDGRWQVVDPNHEGVQQWPRAGIAVTVTRVKLAA